MLARVLIRVAVVAALAGAARADDPWLEKGIAAPRMDENGAAAPETSDRPIPRTSAGRTNAATAVNAAGGSAADAGSGSWSRSTIALAVVLGVIGVLTIASRRWVAPRVGGKPGLIHVLGRTPLSARQSLCLVRVGPQAVLIGVSGDRMAALSVINDPAVTASLAGQALSHSAAFDKSLSKEQAEFARLAAEPAAPETTDAAELASDGQLARLRGRLAETIERLSRRKTA